ncbi:MAG TPA: hypothetical protein VGL29_22565 [Blastocatellia bacterium]
MKKGLLFIFALGAFVSTAIQAAAQPPTNSPPPKVLSIFREDVKASRTGAHEKLEGGYVAALRKANWPVFSIALTPVAGPNDAWFINAYDSFEAMEKDRHAIDKNAELSREFERLDALDAEFRTNQRGFVAFHREDLSYHPTIDLAQIRYFEIITLRARPGHDSEFTDAAKAIRAAFEKKNSPEDHFAIYQVEAGLPAGTYFVFIPMKSLREIDRNMSPENQQAFMKAFGESGFKKFEKLVADSVLSEETAIYAISPKMSYVSKEFAAAGGDFWKPSFAARPVAAKRPAAAPKPAEKKAQQ